MDLLDAVRDLGVADPATDRAGEEKVRAALAQEIDKGTSSVALAASATAVTLLLSATASPPPAFAVTRHHDGSVSVKINRPTSIADVNRRLVAMGIERIGKRAMAADR